MLRIDFRSNKQWRCLKLRIFCIGIFTFSNIFFEAKFLATKNGIFFSNIETSCACGLGKMKIERTWTPFYGSSEDPLIKLLWHKDLFSKLVDNCLQIQTHGRKDGGGSRERVGRWLNVRRIEMLKSLSIL